MTLPAKTPVKPLEPPRGSDYRLFFFSELLKRPVCAGQIRNRLGKLSDLVFHLKEPYPEALGIYIEHGWGKPSEFVPWDRVVKIEKDAIFVKPPEQGEQYPPFVDQPGWILAEKHLMGRTIFDMDGRRTEVVNDVHLLQSKGRMVIVHVDVSFNGFLRRWGLRKMRWVKDRLISWRYVQPLSLEDAAATDKVSLSVTRDQMRNLPGEDLADILEELSGEQQEALFSALESEKAAEALVEAEPRAQRQIIANLRQERARAVLSEMSVPQLADLFSVLPHDDVTDLMKVLPTDLSQRVHDILSEREVTARALMSEEYVSAGRGDTVGAVLAGLRQSKREPQAISYLYILNPQDRLLEGVVDLREVVLAPDQQPLEEIMTAPVVAAEADDTWEDLAELFRKYHLRMLPVVDRGDHVLGVVHYGDIMKGTEARLKT